MHIIKVTSFHTKKPIYINIDAIGHFFEVEAEIEHGRVKAKEHTVIGATTHNNGGFKVTESVDKILKLIEEIKE